MGITVDVIPLGPDEEPPAAVSRVYDGAGTWTPREGWALPIIERVEALHDWQREDTDSVVYLWSTKADWQVEFNRDDVTLRRRRHHGASAVSDAALLRAFADLPAIAYVPDSDWWTTLDDLPDDFRLLG